MSHPYRSLGPQAFWRTGTKPDEAGLIPNLYQPRFQVTPKTRIATAGSCFAQHISDALRQADCTILDAEPPLRGMPADMAARFGYRLFSGRYGNIYTARQMRELLDEIDAESPQTGLSWSRNHRFYDALRPNVEPEGLNDPDEVIAHRRYHLAKVRQMLGQVDLFILTLGMTEAWIDKPTGRTLPICPGVIAGDFDPEKHCLHRFNHDEICDDLGLISTHLKRFSNNASLLLTVSPVAMTATAGHGHVVTTSAASKATLRAAVETHISSHPDSDYFPAFEIVTSPTNGGPWFEQDGRQVSKDGVKHVMDYFFGAHGLSHSRPTSEEPAERDDDDIICEEILLQTFGQ